MKKNLLYIIFGILTFILVSLFLFFGINIKLEGTDMTVTLNEKYEEPGYNLYFYGIKLNKKINTLNNVKTNIVGEYNLIYETNILFHYKKVRKVNVKEYERPVITLEGKSYACPGTIYVEEGYKAIDNYDGDITSLVNITNYGTHIIYNVSDTSNNMAEVKRIIKYEDIEKPVIELTNANMRLYKGDNYSEPGYKATDNCLGDLTSKVEVSGSVDTSKGGTYTVTYKVSDGYNETEQKRYVTVIDNTLPSTSWVSTSSKPGVIYLTFDDGPEVNSTPIILDILKKYNVPATFFIVPKGNTTDYLITREYNEGHSIGIHSSSHVYSSIYSSDNALYEDINIVNNKIKSITGSYSYLYRYPGGSSNTVSRNYSRGIVTRTSKELHNMGYHYFDWNISSTDASSPTPPSSEIANQVISHLSKNRANVVLMHDSKMNTAYALESIIVYGLEHGYTFEPITMETSEVHHGINN